MFDGRLVKTSSCIQAVCGLLLFRSTVKKSIKKKNVKFARRLVYTFKVINKEREKTAVIAKEISTLEHIYQVGCCAPSVSAHPFKQRQEDLCESLASQGCKMRPCVNK